MPRSLDLDTIAPDDLIPPTPVSPPALKKLKKKKVQIVPPHIPYTNPQPPSPPPLSAKIYDIFGHTKSPFSSSLVMPKFFNFVEKNDDETILLALRSHWFTNVSWILTTIFMLFVPTLINFIPASLFSPTLEIVITFAWYLLTFAYAFEQFLSWYFDLFIITDRRVVDIDFNNLLDKKFSEANLDKIQDVSSRVSGVSQTFFNYGTVLIQTAAEQNVIAFEKIPSPEKVTKLLQDLRNQEEDNSNGGND